MRKAQPLTYMISLTMFLMEIVPQVAEAKFIRCNSGDVQCLISAINEANANGQTSNTIQLATGVYGLTAVDNVTDGANGLPSITSTLTIRGSEVGTTLITHANVSPAFRLVHVGTNGHLTVDRVMLSGGSSSVPGALYNAGGGLTISDSVVTANFATGLINIGGIVTVTKTVFANNLASTAGAGAIMSSGQVSIFKSTIVGNKGFDTGGAMVMGGKAEILESEFRDNHGDNNVGGLWAFGESVVSIRYTTFRANVAKGGGGMRVGASNDPATVSVKDSAFLDNICDQASGGAAMAIFAGDVDVTNTTVARNIEYVTTPTTYSAAIAVLNVSSGTLHILNSTFAGNRTYIPVPFVATIFSGPNSTTILQNTIVTHDPGQGLVQDCDGLITSLGNNIISNLFECRITLQPTDLTGDPGLGPFLDNSAPGNGHFQLLPASRAVDAGNDAACPNRDQIGQSRLRQCDIGAIEFHNDYKRVER